MRGLSYISTHEDDAFDRLKQDFKDKGNFKDLIGVFAARAQAFEDIAYPMIEAMYIANATGKTLEMIGENIGQPRPTYGPAADDDNAYRVLIYAKIAANTSYGTIPDIYNVLGSLGLGSVRVFDVYPASITVNYIPNNLTLTCACVRHILVPATPPIGMDITEHSETPFGFEGDPTAFGFGVGEIGAAG